MSAINGTSGSNGRKFFTPTPGWLGVADVADIDGSAGTVGVISSSGGGSVGTGSSGRLGNAIAMSGTSTGLFNTFSAGSLARVGIMGIAE
jgi:hypothetical protein